MYFKSYFLTFLCNVQLVLEIGIISERRHFQIGQYFEEEKKSCSNGTIIVLAFGQYLIINS